MLACLFYDVSLMESSSSVRQRRPDKVSEIEATDNSKKSIPSTRNNVWLWRLIVLGVSVVSSSLVVYFYLGRGKVDFSVEEQNPFMIYNEYDKLISKDLETCYKLLNGGYLSEAYTGYKNLLSKKPHSPQAAHGIAKTLDAMAENKRSNDILDEALQFYEKALNQPDITEDLYVHVGARYSNRLIFRGSLGKAVFVLKTMILRYPLNMKIRNSLGISLLISGNVNEAKAVFEQVLSIDSNNGLAAAHLGFILKTSFQKYEEAIPLLYQGIQSNEEGTSDGRFYLHLGESLQRVGRQDESREVYEKGAQIGVFLSPMQRSLYNMPLKSQPFWSTQESGQQKYLKVLENRWVEIQEEAARIFKETLNNFRPEDEYLRKSGNWSQLSLFIQGHRQPTACKLAPITCEIISNWPDAAFCSRGQAKFSVMFPGTHVWPHTGPTNCRLRAHLGLVVPEGVTIRIVETNRTWEEGKVFVFDDSFEHEVIHNGDKPRIILIVDFWHPEISEYQKKTLPPI